MRSAPQDTTAAATWNLFLSSTVKDLNTYRRAVRDACRNMAETACFLSEDDWGGGYDDTVTKCLSRVASANAFLLVVGHWYGSIPPGRNRSITHLEFEGALKKWQGSPFPPMAVMMPAQGSPADKQLKKVAKRLLDAAGVDPAEHENSLNTFRTELTGAWRTVVQFKSKAHLREHAIARCWEWKGRTPLAASRGEVVVEAAPVPAAQVTDEQLGALGREKPFGAVRRLLAKLADHADVPGVALAVAGDDDSGQRPFMQRLGATVLKHCAPKPRIARLPVDCGHPAVLVSWIGRSLGLPEGSGIETPEQLAALVAPELKRQPLAFTLDRIGDLAGGVAAFREMFWQPFYRELHRLRNAQAFTHRVIALVADYSGDPLPPAVTAAPEATGDVRDYSLIVELPRLEPFDRDQVLAWFDELEVPDEPAGRRAALATRALQDSRGRADPVPIRVFERLRGEALWPAGEEI